MPYWRLFYHIVWSTKGRAPLISPDISDDLYRLVTSKAQGLGALVHAVGGVADHLHLVVSVPPAISLGDFVGLVKGSSSHAINRVLQPAEPLAWQSEYGVVTFGGRELDRVVKYVHTQGQHHAEGTTIPFLERQAPLSATKSGS